MNHGRWKSILMVAGLAAGLMLVTWGRHRDAAPPGGAKIGKIVVIEGKGEVMKKSLTARNRPYPDATSSQYVGIPVTAASEQNSGPLGRKEEEILAALPVNGKIERKNGDTSVDCDTRSCAVLLSVRYDVVGAELRDLTHRLQDASTADALEQKGYELNSISFETDRHTKHTVIQVGLTSKPAR